MPYGSDYRQHHKAEMRRWRYGLMKRQAEKNLWKMNLAYDEYKRYDRSLYKAYKLAPWGSNWKLKLGPQRPSSGFELDYAMRPRYHDAHVTARRVMHLEKKKKQMQKLGSYLKRKYEEDLIKDIAELNR